MKSTHFSMLRSLVIYFGFFLLIISCGRESGKYAEFVATMLRIRDSLRVLDTNNKVTYYIDAADRVGCEIKIRHQTINNTLFETQCEDCFSFTTGKGPMITHVDSFNYKDDARGLYEDILNNTPKDLIWDAMSIVYDKGQDTSFCYYFSKGTPWGLCWGTGKKRKIKDSSGYR